MPDQEEDERFHLNLEDIKEFAIFRIDPEGRIASWNEGAKRVKGYTAEEAIGQPFAMLFTPEDAAAGRPAWELQQAREKKVYQGEGIRMRKGGERFDAEVTLRALSDKGGVHRGFVKVTQDISARKRFEAELRKRAEFEQQLIGIVSHDLRTPLSAITLATTLLLRSDSLQARHRATLMRVLFSSERAQRLIGSLLDFTQARVGGGFVLHYSFLDLQDFISLAVEEVRLVHPDNELQLKFSGAGQGRWDADRLAQLLTNLLNNAILHGLQDKPVQLHVNGGPDTVLLSVHNWGAPIPAEMVPHLFEPMRRGDNAALPSRSKSMGLGLYIVQQIVLAHGGTIEVSSSEEQGTTFRVCLPRSPPSRKARGDAPSEP